MRRAWQAFSVDWPIWWTGLKPWRKVAPAASAAALWIGYALLGGFRSDHLWMGLAILALGYGGRGAGTLLRFLLPIILAAVVYDTQRFYSDYIRGAVRVTEPYDFDKRFFGITTASGVLTPNEWLQLHTHWVLDFVCGLAYLIFIGVFVIQSGYFALWLKIPGAFRQMWAFFWVNVIGYSTYYWYPAAPPWYVALNGTGPAKMDTLPNPAGCVRFDALLGTHFFTGMYGRSADVFGAIPSLHIAYPLISVFFAFKYGRLQAWSVFFFSLMCFSAVYLNHHYILDILWGSAYAVIVMLAIDRLSKKLH